MAQVARFASSPPQATEDERLVLGHLRTHFPADARAREQAISDIVARTARTASDRDAICTAIYKALSFGAWTQHGESLLSRHHAVQRRHGDDRAHTIKALTEAIRRQRTWCASACDDWDRTECSHVRTLRMLLAYAEFHPLDEAPGTTHRRQRAGRNWSAHQQTERLLRRVRGVAAADRKALLAAMFNRRFDG